MAGAALTSMGTGEILHGAVIAAIATVGYDRACLLRAHLGHVDVEVVSRIWLALLLLRMGALGIWQAADARLLQAAVERASRQVEMVAETVIVNDVEQVFEGVTNDLTSEFFKCRG